MARFEAGTRRWKTHSVITQITNVAPEQPTLTFLRQPYEDLPVGTPFARLQAIDRNGDAVVWVQQGGAGGTDPRVQIAGNGFVSVKTPWDFETQSHTMVLKAQAQDQRGGALDVTFTVTMLDVFEAPLPTAPKVSLPVNTLVELSPPGTVIGNLVVTDPDVGESYTFDLVDNANGRVALDPIGKRIVAGDTLARLADGNFTIKVNVTDSNGLSSGPTELPIQVLNVNEAPGLPTVETAFVSESQPLHVPFSKILLTDPDPGDTVEVTIVNDPDSKFEIVIASGLPQLALKAAVNFTTAQSHTVTLMATDAAGLTTSLETVIEVRPSTVQAGKIAGPTFFMRAQWIAEPTDDANLQTMGVNVAFHRSSSSPLTEDQWVAGHRTNGMKYVLTPAAAGAYAQDQQLVAFLQANKPTTQTPADIGSLKSQWNAALPAGQGVPAIVNLEGNSLTEGRGYANASLWDYVEGSESDWVGSESYPEAQGMPVVRPVATGEYISTPQGIAVDILKRWAPNKAVFQSIQSSDFTGNGTPDMDKWSAQLWSAIIHGASGVVMYNIPTDPSRISRITTEFARIKQIEGIIIDTQNGGARAGTLYRCAPQYSYGKKAGETASTWKPLIQYPVPVKDTAPAGTKWGRGTAIGSSYSGVLGTTPLPTGCSLSGTVLSITDDNVTFDNWDMRNYRVEVYGQNCTIKNCDFNHGGPPTWGSYANRDFPPVISQKPGAHGFVCVNNTFNGQKVKPGASSTVALAARFYVGFNIITNMPSDGFVLQTGCSGIVEWNYYENNGYNDGAHMDAIEFIGCSGPVVIRRNYMNGFRPLDVTDPVFSTDPSSPNYQSGVNSCIKMYEELGNTYDSYSIITENIFLGSGLQLDARANAAGDFIGIGHHEVHNNWFGDDSRYGPNCWITAPPAGQPPVPKAVHVYDNKRLIANAVGPAGGALQEYNVDKGRKAAMGPQLTYPFEGRVISTSQGDFFIILNLSGDTVDFNELGFTGVSFGPYECKTGFALTGTTDTIPNDFTTPNLTEQALNATISSPLIKITGINAASPVHLTGSGEFRVVDTDGTTEVRAWGTADTTVLVNQYVQRRVTTPNSNGATVSQSLDIGGVVRSWSVTTLLGAVTSVPLYKQSGWNVNIPWQVAGKDFSTGLVTARSSLRDARATGQPGVVFGSDTMDIVQPGVYENLYFSGGSIYVRADDVTLRNCLVDPGNTPIWQLIWHGQGKNLILENVECDGKRFGSPINPAIHCDQQPGDQSGVGQWKGYRVSVHGVAQDGFFMRGGEMYECSYLDGCYGPGAHGDCVETIGTYGRALIWRCTLLMGDNNAPGGQDAAIKNWQELGHIFQKPLIVEENVMAGGTYICRQPNVVANQNAWRTTINNRFGIVIQTDPWNGGPLLTDNDPQLCCMENKWYVSDPKQPGSGPGNAVPDLNPGVRAATVNDLSLTNPSGLNVHGTFTTHSTGRGKDEFRYRLSGSERWSWSNECPTRGVLDFTAPSSGRYEVIVRSWNDQNGVVVPGLWSPFGYVTVGGGAPPATPGTVSDLAVVGSPLATQATLNFTAGANSPAFQARTNGGTPFAISPSVVGGKQQFDLAGLSASTAYTVEVRGNNSGTFGAWSNVASFTTAATGGGEPGGGGGGGGGGGEHAATAAYAAAIAAANGGTAYPTAWRAAIDTFIKALDVATNGVWPYMVRGYIMANDSKPAAKMDLKTAAIDLTVVSGESEATFTRKAGLANGRYLSTYLFQNTTGWQYTLAGVGYGGPLPTWDAIWVAGNEMMAVGISYDGTNPNGFYIRDAQGNTEQVTSLVPAENAMIGISRTQGSVVSTLRSGTNKGSQSATYAFDVDNSEAVQIHGYEPWGGGSAGLRCAFIFTRNLSDAEWAVLNNAWSALYTTIQGLS